METETEPRLEPRIEAARAGRRIYLVRKGCRKCKCRLRYTSSGACVPCTKDRSVAYNEQLRKILREAE